MAKRLRLAVVLKCPACDGIHEWLPVRRLIPPDAEGRDLRYTCPVKGVCVKLREGEAKGKG